MISLEKMMYFIPNRYFVDGGEMYVSFNIAVIPVDMIVTDMVVHIRIIDHSHHVSVFVYKLESGWDEVIVQNGFRPIKIDPFINTLQPVVNKELIVPIFSFAESWRFDSYNNHGICVKCDSASFDIANPPYLLVSTL